MRRPNRQSITNKRITDIWPAWCALPAEYDSAERVLVLTGKRLHYGDYQKQYNRLVTQFDRLLPISLSDYQDALNAVAEWWNLVEVGARCVSQNIDDDSPQLRYESFDKQLVGFVAQHRALREIAALRPDLLVPGKCPTLTDIQLVRERCNAYLVARRDAVKILSPLIFSPALRAEHKQPSEKQTPEFSAADFPKHLYIARLKAFGKCSGPPVQFGL